MSDDVTLKTLIHAKLLAVGTTLLNESFPDSPAEIGPDGNLMLEGEAFESLSSAMKKLVSEEDKSVNGWLFWRYFDEEKDYWAPLDHMRLIYEHRAIKDLIKTSDSHPLRIDSVVYPDGGLIGMTICPGKQGFALYGGKWNRNIALDLKRIEDWNTDTLITLMEDQEFQKIGVAGFKDAADKSQFTWVHIPIRDTSIPSQQAEQLLSDVMPTIHETLQAKGRIVIHCRGGLGRTGLLAARILIEAGMEAQNAIDYVRKQRPGAIETYEQERYLFELNHNQYLTSKPI